MSVIDGSQFEWVERPSKHEQDCRGLTSHRHIIGHIGDGFYRSDDHTNSDKALEETSWSSRSSLNPTRTISPCYNNTTLSNRLYTRRRPTNPICWSCKNCSYKCAACWLWTLCHTIQHRAVLIIFFPNFQTITITRMLSSGGEGDKHKQNW